MRRSFLWGLLALLAFASSPIRAQIRGEVETIGFQNVYRPDCWTQIVVHLIPDASTPGGDYQIQVKQEDLDRDHPIFTRNITLTGANSDGRIRDQRFSVYFKPQPTGDGLPDANDPGRNSIQQLQDLLQVSLCTTSGKFINSLPITHTIQSVDPKAGNGERRGMKLILAVTDGRSSMSWKDYEHSIGLLEDVAVVTVRPSDLPESVIGYEAIDGIVWLGGDPNELKSGGDERFRALENYISRGGRLIISTPTEWQRLLSFGDLLPVTIEGTENRDSASEMKAIVRETMKPPKANQLKRNDSWDGLRGPFSFARASSKEGALVDSWIDWKPNGAERTPWIVRRVNGSGSVTWVAQDLGDPLLLRAHLYGWPLIWDHIFDWKNDTLTVTPDTVEAEKAPYAPASGINVGAALLNGMELGTKSLWLITVAIVFFIAYWIVAGPGAYAFLVMKKQTGASWFIFAAAALGATALTVVLVKATLRGPATMKHVSLVRVGETGPAHVHSRFGLYIPRDGVQQIELKDMTADTVASITAFGIHPSDLPSGSVPDDPGPDYEVAPRDASSTGAASIGVPFRTTLKKLEADWSGDLQTRITGSAKLLDNKFIEGSITNATGQRLRDVYIGFKYGTGNTARNGDWLLYLPTWEPGMSLDLNKEFNVDENGKQLKMLFLDTDRSPDRGNKVLGRIDRDWQPFWFRKMTSQSFIEEQFTDYSRAVPLLSFFDRLPPSKNERGYDRRRFELIRRSARRYDISSAMSAGGLVVIASSDLPEKTPIPMPMEVEGDKLEGTGMTLYQCVLPLDCSIFNSPATQPAE